MVDTTIKYNLNTTPIQKITVSLNNDKNYEKNMVEKFVSTGFNHEPLSERKAAEIFSSVAKTFREGNVGKHSNMIRNNKTIFHNDEKEKHGLYV